MKPTLLLVVVAAAMGALAPVGAHASFAGRDDASPRGAEALRSRPEGGREHGMRAFANPAGPGDAAYGWRYFTDADAARAVVIGPDGAYYFNEHGDGLQRVALTQRAN